MGCRPAADVDVRESRFFNIFGLAWSWGNKSTRKFKSNINTFLTKLRRWIKYVPNFPTHLHRAQGQDNASAGCRGSLTRQVANYSVAPWPFGCRPCVSGATHLSFSIQISRTKSNNKKKSTEIAHRNQWINAKHVGNVQEQNTKKIYKKKWKTKKRKTKVK